MKKFLKFIFLVLFWFTTFLVHLWSALAIAYVNLPQNSPYIKAVVLIYLVIVFAVVLVNQKKTRTLLLSLVIFGIVCVWYVSVKPKTEAQYPQHLQMPHAEFKEDLVTIHNVRNNDYRTRDDFDVHYDIRTYSLNKLETLDIFINYWGMDAIAHAFVSFGFSDGKHIAVSIETRPEVGEVYGLLDGFFKRYELIYVWGDERDLVRTRTNYRKEDAYLYRVNMERKNIKKMFMSMIKRTNNLYETQEFYNTLFESCTNTLGDHIKSEGIMEVPFWKRRFLSGSVDQRMYNEGMLIDMDLPFIELRRAANINERALAADKSRNFSKEIRTHIK